MSTRRHFKIRLAKWLQSDDFQTWLRSEDAWLPNTRLKRRLELRKLRAERLSRLAENFREARHRSAMTTGFFGAFGVLAALVVFGLLMAAVGLVTALLGLALRVAVVVGIIWLVVRFFGQRRSRSQVAIVPYRDVR